MIVSFRCRETATIWQGRSSRAFPADIQDRALRKLRQLDAARTMDDLRNPPGNRLEALKGDRKGQLSTRINDQWRLCFVWSEGEASEVETSITTEGRSELKGVTMGELRNPHPGEILKEDFLNEIGMSQNQLAQALGVPGNRIHAIVNGTRDITADTDLRLCKFFGLSEGYFLRLQNAHDTLEAKRRIAAEVDRITPYAAGKAA